MFDIGFLEVCIIFVIALLVLGPERMPGAVRQVAGWIRAIRRTTRSWSDEVNRQLDNEELQRSLREELKMQELSDDLQEARASLDAVLEEPRR